MRARRLRVFISGNRNGPFVELKDCVHVPSVADGSYEFWGHDTDEFRKAWDGVLQGREVAAAVFLYKVENAVEQRYAAWIGPLHEDKESGYLCGPVGRLWEVK